MVGLCLTGTCIPMFAAWHPAPASIAGVSYTYQRNGPNHPVARDAERKILTDGRAEPGAQDLDKWSAVLREQGNPLTLRFDLGQRYHLVRVTLHYLDDWTSGITAPTQVQLRLAVPGTETAPPITVAVEPAKKGSGRLAIEVPEVTARFVDVTILNWGGGWTFLSELRFEGWRDAPEQEGGR